MTEVRLSVVLPVFNGARYLTAALASIHHQTFRDFEVVLVDDGSTDETPQIISDWVRRDSRFRVIRHRTNLNCANARNTGLENARNPLVLQADADDINEPERFAIQAETARGHPEMGIIGTNLTHNDNSTWRCPATSDGIRAQLLWGPPFGHPSVLLNQKVLGDFRYDPDYEYCEDLDLWLRFVYRVPTMNIQRKLVWYRHPAGSLSRTLSARRLEIERILMRRRSHLLNTNLDADAGLACLLGNRAIAIGSTRISTHIVHMARTAINMGVASPEAILRTVRQQSFLLWRNYGLSHLATDLPQLVRNTLKLFYEVKRHQTGGHVQLVSGSY